MNAKAKCIAAELLAVAMAGAALYGAFELVMRSMPVGATRDWTFGAAFLVVLGLLAYMNDLVNEGRAGWLSIARSRVLEDYARADADERLASIASEVRVSKSVTRADQARILSAVSVAAADLGDVSLADACQRATGAHG